MAFLTAHIHVITATAFATATEKIAPQVKQMLKLKRKKSTSV